MPDDGRRSDALDLRRLPQRNNGPGKGGECTQAAWRNGVQVVRLQAIGQVAAIRHLPEVLGEHSERGKEANGGQAVGALPQVRMGEESRG